MLNINNYRIGMIERQNQIERTLLFYKIKEDRYYDLISKREYSRWTNDNKKDNSHLFQIDELYDYITPSSWTSTGATEEDTLEFNTEQELIEFLKKRNFKSYSEEIEEQEKTTYVH